MTVAAAPALMTTEQLLAMPEDGVERWLIRGQLREKPRTKHNRWHSRIMVRVAYVLERWSEQQPEPRGSVLCGEAGCILRHDPDTSVGIDVVYISPDLAANASDETTMIDGVPVLVVEILSPNDTQIEIHEKIDSYRAAGVALVWIIDPHDRTITIYRPGSPPQFINDQQMLSAEPHLPGFQVPAAQLFN